MYCSRILLLLSTVALVSCDLPVAAKTRNDCGLDKPLNVTTRQQLSELIDIGDSLGSKIPCPDETRTAIKELSLIVDDDQNVCSQDKADRIRDFHDIYLASDTDGSIKLPKSIRQFFIGYALKVSRLCRHLAIEQLVAASSSLLEPYDFEIIDKFTDDKSALSGLIREPSDQDNLVLPKNLVRLLRLRGPPVEQEKLYIKTGTTRTILRLRQVCTKKFRPIYEKLLLPLITLSSSGYNFEGSSNDADERPTERSQVSKQVFQWYRITLLCETIENIELISAREAGEKSNLIKVLSKEEAVALRQKSPELFADWAKQKAAIKPIVYVPNYATAPQIGDLIIDLQDKKLIKKIKSFKNGNAVTRFLRKVGKSAKEQLASGLTNLVISKNAIVLADGKQVSSAKDLVKVIDDYIHNEGQPGKAPSDHTYQKIVMFCRIILFALFVVGTIALMKFG